MQNLGLIKHKKTDERFFFCKHFVVFFYVYLEYLIFVDRINFIYPMTLFEVM